MASYRYKPKSTTPPKSIYKLQFYKLPVKPEIWNWAVLVLPVSPYFWFLNEITHTCYNRTLGQSASVLWSQPHSQAWPIWIYPASLLASPDVGTLCTPASNKTCSFCSCHIFSGLMQRFWLHALFHVIHLKSFLTSNCSLSGESKCCCTCKMFPQDAAYTLHTYTHTHTQCLLGQRHTHKHINLFRRCRER